jgi:uncharacterized Zn-finger protein
MNAMGNDIKQKLESFNQFLSEYGQKVHFGVSACDEYTDKYAMPTQFPSLPTQASSTLRHLSHSFLSHFTNEQEDSGAFPCTMCDKTYTRKDTLARHMKRHAGVKGQYQCTECNKEFSQKQHLAYHMLSRAHVPEGPHQCSICDKRFNRKDILSRHMQIHSGEKAFKCDACDKVFSQKHHLTHHLASGKHNGEPTYGCNICDRSFYSTSSLIRHKKIHLGR